MEKKEINIKRLVVGIEGGPKSKRRLFEIELSNEDYEGRMDEKSSCEEDKRLKEVSKGGKVEDEEKVNIC